MLRRSPSKPAFARGAGAARAAARPSAASTGAAVRGAVSAAALAAALAPSWAGAEVVRLGAGEHADYSRVVLNMTPPEGWRVRTTPQGVEIVLPGAGRSLDAAAVVDRRRAHRVDAAALRREAEGDVLRLGFVCDCSATAFALGDRAIVIDVRDGAVRSDAPTKATPAPATAAAAANAGAAAVPTRTALETDVERAREMLLRQLQRAADEGFVSFRDTGPAAAPDQNTSADATADAGAPAAMAAAAPPAFEAAPEAPKLAPTPAASPEPVAAPRTAPIAEISAPVPPAAARADAPAAFPEPDCAPAETFDAAAWIDDRPFAEGLAARRAGLFDDLNRIVPEAAVALVEFYLGHGLGAEAALMAEGFAAEAPEAALLADIGRALDGMSLAADSPLLRRQPCEGVVALWQALALTPVDPAAAAAAFRASGRSLARAPEPHRRMLGAPIALAAAQAGDVEVAAAILSLLERSLDAPNAEMRLAAAELALAEGRTVAAQALLAEVADGRTPLRALATMRLAATLDRPIYAARAARVADALEEMTFQHRGAPMMVELVSAEASLRARFGDLRRALSAIADAERRLEGSPLDRARLEGLERMLLGDEIAAFSSALAEGQPAEAARVVAVADAVRALPADAEADALRAALARHLIDSHAPKVAALVADETAARRSAELAALRREAQETAALLAKVGPAPSAGLSDPALETGDLEIGARTEAQAQARREERRRALREAALSSYAAGAPPPLALTQPEVDPADLADPNGAGGGDALAAPERRTLEGLFDRRAGVVGEPPRSADEGRRLIEQIDAEIDLLKDMAEDG